MLYISTNSNINNICIVFYSRSTTIIVQNLILSSKFYIWFDSIKYVLCSAVKRLIVINRIQNKSFCLHKICVYCAYLLWIYKYKHMHVFKKNMLCLYIYIIKYKYINVYTCKYFQNIYSMCVYLYIHNKYTQYTYKYIYYVNKNFYFGCD